MEAEEAGATGEENTHSSLTPRLTYHAAPPGRKGC